MQGKPPGSGAVNPLEVLLPQHLFLLYSARITVIIAYALHERHRVSFPALFVQSKDSLLTD